MDTLALLTNARIKDLGGEFIAEVVGVHIVGGKMVIVIDMELDDDEDEDDPYDGAKEDIPEDDAARVGFPKIAVVGKKTGTNNG